MAKSKKNNRPAVTLVILAVVIGGLYGLVALSGSWTPKLGLDLRGGTTITLTASTTNGTVSAASLELARSILQQRVDGLGVGETEVTTSGDKQIIVSAPNVQKDELVKLVGTTAELNFRKVYKEEAVTTTSTSTSTSEATTAASGSASTSEATASTAPTATATATTAVSAAASSTASANRRPLPELPTPVPSPRPTVAGKTKALATLLKWTPSTRDTSDFTNYQCGDDFPDVSTEPLITCNKEGTYKYLLGPVLIKGEQISTAQAGVPSNSVSWVVNLTFKSQGATDFQTVTAHLSSQTSPENQFGIVLDGTVISAPSVASSYTTGISGGKAEISGSFTQSTATQLANVLAYGALPLAFDVSSVDNVSAKLGGDQLAAGLIAGAIGLALVLAYSILYYRGLSVVVALSLVVAGTLTWALLVLLGQALGVALNLPGIAGAIVSIGVTADSFIIYFERIRDEVREGRSLRTAIESGWLRSRKTIVVADSVSLLSATVLFILAIGAVRGFAFTLGLTTLIDLVVVFFFTKPLMTLLGRTKFYGEGHRFSGFESEHMGVTRASSRAARRSRTATSGGAA